MNTIPTCSRCGFHRWASDHTCAGCARLDAQEREKTASIEQSDSRYVRIVNGKRVYSATPPKNSIHDPNARKRDLRGQNFS